MDLTMIAGALLAVLVFGGLAFLDDVIDLLYPVPEELEYE